MTRARTALSTLAFARTLVSMGAVLALGSACSPYSARSPAPSSSNVEPLPETLRQAASDGVDSARIRSVLERKLDLESQANPVLATYNGDHRFDAQAGDLSTKGHERVLAWTRSFLEELRDVERGSLTPRDVVTMDLLERDLRNTLATEPCEDWLWNVSTMDNALTYGSVSLRILPLKTAKERANYASRLRSLAAAFDELRTNLETGAARGLVASQVSVTRTLHLVEDELGRPSRAWGLLEPLKDLPKELPESERTAYVDGLVAIVERDVRPATQRYRDTLRDVVLPRARSEQKPGLVSMTNGAACYRARIAIFTTQERSAEELHRIGLEQVAKANEGLRVLGAKSLGTDSLDATIKRLRDDASLYFATSEEVEVAARTAVARAQRALPSAFATVPRTACEVEPVPKFEAAYAPVAFYRQATMDGTQVAKFLVNTDKPTTRPRFEAEVTAFHEAVPGHHLQIALAQEERSLPFFRRSDHVTAFVEGWGLYAERLAEDMGLYSSDLDRIGMLSFDAWRGSRLVVDTGLHALGWSREQAIRYMLEHTALAPANIEVEVDRYIGMPGQALAYKVGQLELLRLRGVAEKELGARFDLRGFHTAVLSHGSVTMGMLDKQVRAWIATTLRASAPAASGPAASKR